MIGPDGFKDSQDSLKNSKDGLSSDYWVYDLNFDMIVDLK